MRDPINAPASDPVSASTHDDAGFALLDAIVGVIIAGVCAGALLSLLVHTSRSAERTEHNIEAWAWAQALVETAPQASGAREVRHGVTPDGAYDWTLTLEIEGDPAFERAVAEVRHTGGASAEAILGARRSRQ